MGSTWTAVLTLARFILALVREAVAAVWPAAQLCLILILHTNSVRKRRTRTLKQHVAGALVHPPVLSAADIQIGITSRASKPQSR